MRGFQPAKAKAKAQSLASGGPVRGPGTGTSDDVQGEVPEGTYVMPADSTAAVGEPALAGMGKDVPVNLSNGEFTMPPEQVHAVGVQALDQIKNSTHTPVGFGPAAAQQQPGQEPEPRMFFADGGVVDEERRRPISPTNTFPQGSPSAGASVYQGAGFSAGQLGSSGQFAQVPASIGQQPGRQPAAQAPAPVVPTPAPAAMPAAAAPVQKTPPAADPQQGLAAVGFNPNIVRQAQRAPGAIAAAASTPDPMLADAGKSPATLYMQDRAQEMRGQIDAGNYAGAAGTVARTAVQGLGMYGLDISNALVNPVLDVGGRMVGGLLGTDTPAGQVRADAPAPAVQPGAAVAGAGRGMVNPAAANPSAPAPVVQPQATQVMDGVFRSGNSYGDSAQTAIAGAAPRGLPTAQNAAAADALAQRSAAESSARVTAGRGFGPGSGPVEPGSFTGGFSGVIGTDPAAARERRDLVRSMTTPMRGAQNGQLTASQRAGMAGLMESERRDASGNRQADQTAATQVGIAAMREQGDTGRAVMREQGESGRAADRNALDSRRVGVEEQARGFDIRAGQRQERLHQQYEAAKTPEARAAIARQIRDLSGKTENIKDNFMTLGGGQEWDAKAGTMRNVPQRLVDLRTGQEMGGAQPAAAAGPAQPTSKAEYDALPKGATYTRNGVTYTKG